MSHLSGLIRCSGALMRQGAVRQVGGLCYRMNVAGLTEILLITTRRTRRWTIPKGWPIKGLEMHEAAQREAWEEAGVKGRVRKRIYGMFGYEKILASGITVPATVQVHLLETRETRSWFPERSERKLLWLPPSEASRLVEEKDLKALLSRFSRRMAPR
jgi:8-oxo-dGTP pyrophosphatase MutT (NUDIX family)